MAQSLLLNWVYAPPVGHAIEALKVARGFERATRDLEIHVLLDDRSPVELTEACPWIARGYGVDVRGVARRGARDPSLAGIPREFDYVLTDQRIENGLDKLPPEFAACHRVLAPRFAARRFKGFADERLRDARPSPPGSARAAGPPPYVWDAPIRLKLPARATRFARRYRHAGPGIAILPAGSGSASFAPEPAWWARLARALEESIDDVRIYFTGATHSERDRTHTRAYPRRELDRLIGRCPNAVDAFDIGLWNQLALIRSCDVFVSPHSGFAFVAPCVGTRVVEVSGGRWPIHLFNRVPFESVLPACRLYPCHSGMKSACERRLAEGSRVLCMDKRNLGPRTTEVVSAVQRMLDPRISYRDALEEHVAMLARADVNHAGFWTFDGADLAVRAGVKGRAAGRSASGRSARSRRGAGRPSGHRGS